MAKLLAIMRGKQPPPFPLFHASARLISSYRLLLRFCSLSVASKPFSDWSFFYLGT